MITTFLLAGYLLHSQQGQPITTKAFFLPIAENSPTKLLLREYVDPLKESKKSPKTFGESQRHWEFDWCIEGDASVQGDGPVDSPRYRPYFLTFSQEHKSQGDTLEPVTRMLLRLWDFDFKKLGVSHNPKYQGGIVEVFLCFGGKAGGEQDFALEKEKNLKTGDFDDVPANTIYIYDLASFADPVEMAREVAHEYGHATLVGVGGYKEPEEWANGYLGEKLFLRWMREAMAKGELGPGDAMGATQQGLDKWVATNVDPLIEKSAQVLPTDAVMSDKSAAGMDEYIGLSLYMDTLYSDRVFSRSMQMIGSIDAKDYPPAAILAAEEPDQMKLNIPAYLYGKLIWIPLGTGKLSGTSILKKDHSGWVQIKAGPGPVFVYNTH